MIIVKEAYIHDYKNIIIFFRIDGCKLKITKNTPYFYTYTPQDKKEHIVEGNSDNFVSKLDGLIKNVKSSEVDLQEKKSRNTRSRKKFHLLCKSEAAEQYIDAVINVVLDMFKAQK